MDETEPWPLTQNVNFSNLQGDQRCKCEKNNIPSKNNRIFKFWIMQIINKSVATSVKVNTSKN